MLAMDSKAFNRIDDGDKVIVREVMSRVFTEVEAETRVDNEKAYQALLTIGIERVSVPEESLEEWLSVAKASIGQLIQSGEISPESVERYLANLKAYRDEKGEEGAD